MKTSTYKNPMKVITGPDTRWNYAMQNLKHRKIVMRFHDKIVIEAPTKLSVEEICEQMKQTPT